jgi:hypothetical protein
VQTQLLKDYSSDQIRVYAVWLQMYPTITRDKWDETLMPDRRVMHFWDGQLEVARWFARQVDGYEGISWDMYYLYGPAAVWESAPAPLIGSGGPIYQEHQNLVTQVNLSVGKK